MREKRPDNAGVRASYRGRRRYDSVSGLKPQEGLPDGNVYSN